MKNNISEADWKVRVDLAAMFRLTNMMGWDDTVWNHITARAPGTDHTFFMHEMGLLYEEVKASNLIKVDEHGKVLEGPEKANTAGFIIHSAIHLNHPNAKFVFHAHPPSALAATALKDGIPHLVQDSSMLYGKVGYHEWEGLSINKDERVRIAENMGDNKVLIMKNHGLLTVGATGSGLPLERATEEMWKLSQKQYDLFSPGLNEWPALLRRCDAKDPSYKE